MNKEEAQKLIEQKVKELKSCPFCGVIPTIEYRVDEKQSEHGSIGHFAKRLGCCRPMISGQVELFFCNDFKEPDYGLWAGICSRIVDEWNERKLII